jgi:hypothetical protein
LAEHFRVIEEEPAAVVAEEEPAPDEEAAAEDPLLRAPSPWSGGSIS